MSGRVASAKSVAIDAVDGAHVVASIEGIGPIRALYDAHLNVTPYGRMNFGELTKTAQPFSITSVQVCRSR
jgi:hypothetical protein